MTVIKYSECLWNRHDTEPRWWPISVAIIGNTWHFSPEKAHGQEKLWAMGSDWCEAGRRWVVWRMTFNFRTFWCFGAGILQCCFLKRDGSWAGCGTERVRVKVNRLPGPGSGTRAPVTSLPYSYSAGAFDLNNVWFWAMYAKGWQGWPVAEMPWLIVRI